MFQLIVAVISIALVAALAIASIFYGGEAFTKSSEKANVTALVNQAQQISGAYQLYKTDNGAAPADVSALTPAYLASLPTPPKVVGETAPGVNDVWAIAGSTVEIDLKGAAADVDSDTVCAEITKQAGHKTDGQFRCEAGTTHLKFVFKL